MTRTKICQSSLVLPALALLGLILVAPGTLRAQTPRVPIYPTLAANPDLVLGGPYDTITAGTANWGTGVSGAAHSREFLTVGNRYRLRQQGTISRIRVNLQDVTGLTGFYFRVWRKIGSTYDLVGSSENLASAMIAGPNTLDLRRPIAVLEGDYYGYRVESGTAANFYARTGQEEVRTHYVTDAGTSGTDVNWGSQPSVRGSVLPIEMYLQAPHLVAIGDSIIAGLPVHTTFLETFAGMTRPGNDIVTYLGEQWRVTRQNMGISGQLTREIASRFTADVVNLRPRLALLEGGANNILRGVGTLDSFLADWKRMLDACQTNGIKPLVLLITPGRVYSTAQSQKRDSWNTALRSLAAGYPGAVVVDASASVGANRAGGPADNAWNIATGYSPDGLHFTAKGHQRIAQAIVDQYTEP